MRLEQLRQQVLLLTARDRAALIRDLIDSLESDESGEQISQSSLDEIAARSDVLHRDDVHGIDWRESLESVRERLARKRS